ncbi:hypothetical protein D9758_010973 [Tetrapyrgos nigripes]|uniref:Uncharacterized protein n=1 Tax=Tetrapyrgos nigripes TaxID=182062 RepID=A0A8H5LPS3_9AGAR|nr:hypothetical protein D9758_010973 [Tetrapyrgos nigripes]
MQTTPGWMKNSRTMNGGSLKSNMLTPYRIGIEEFDEQQWAFHCYGGSVSQQDAFVNAFPNKEVYFTECAGMIGSDWWSNIKWYTDNIFISSLEHSSSTSLMWNITLDGNGQPTLPGTNSCGGSGCRLVTSLLREQ